jgi:rhodanese-related sulfurtransferase
MIRKVQSMKKMTMLLGLIFGAANFSFLGGKILADEVQKAMVTRISVQETAKAITASGAAFVDVREVDEFAAVAAKGAKNIPMSTINPGTFESTSGVSKDQNVYIICRSGSRSMKVATALLGQGYQHLYNVEGGTMAWEAAGLPIVRP